MFLPALFNSALLMSLCGNKVPISINATITCDGVPAPNVAVDFWDADNFEAFDDFLGTGRTNKDGVYGFNFDQWDGFCNNRLEPYVIVGHFQCRNTTTTCKKFTHATSDITERYYRYVRFNIDFPVDECETKRVRRSGMLDDVAEAERFDGPVLL